MDATIRYISDSVGELEKMTQAMNRFLTTFGLRAEGQIQLIVERNVVTDGITIDARDPGKIDAVYLTEDSAKRNPSARIMHADRGSVLAIIGDKSYTVRYEPRKLL